MSQFHFQLVLLYSSLLNEAVQTNFKLIDLKEQAKRLRIPDAKLADNVNNDLKFA